MQQSFAYEQTYLKTTLACIGIGFAKNLNSSEQDLNHKKRMA